MSDMMARDIRSRFSILWHRGLRRGQSKTVDFSQQRSVVLTTIPTACGYGSESGKVELEWSWKVEKLL